MRMERQRGETLVSLMVGMLVSAIAIAGMLVVFRNTLQVTARATPAAIADGERISALLRAHTQLQKAGFGAGSPALDTDLVIVGNLVWLEENDALFIKVQQETEGNEEEEGGGGASYAPPDGVIWSSDVDGDGTFLCEGLVTTDAGGLKWIFADDCGSAAQWDSVASWGAIDFGGAGALSGESIELNAQAVAGPCQPFGAASVQGNLSITLTTPLSTGTLATSTTCLANFR